MDAIVKVKVEVPNALQKLKKKIDEAERMIKEYKAAANRFGLKFADCRSDFGEISVEYEAHSLAMTVLLKCELMSPPITARIQIFYSVIHKHDERKEIPHLIRLAFHDLHSELVRRYVLRFMEGYKL